MEILLLQTSMDHDAVFSAQCLHFGSCGAVVFHGTHRDFHMFLRQPIRSGLLQEFNEGIEGQLSVFTDFGQKTIHEVCLKQLMIQWLSVDVQRASYVPSMTLKLKET